MEFEPLWLVFLLLMVGVAASARWILLLRGFSGEISRLKSSVSLGRVFSLSVQLYLVVGDGLHGGASAGCSLRSSAMLRSFSG